MGCFKFMAKNYVQRPCTTFWAFLVTYIILAGLGYRMLQQRAEDAGRTSVFSPDTGYEWTTSGKETTFNMDRVNLARASLNASVRAA